MARRFPERIDPTKYLLDPITEHEDESDKEVQLLATIRNGDARAEVEHMIEASAAQLDSLQRNLKKFLKDHLQDFAGNKIIHPCRPLIYEKIIIISQAKMPLSSLPPFWRHCVFPGTPKYTPQKPPLSNLKGLQASQCQFKLSRMTYPNLDSFALFIMK